MAKETLSMDCEECKRPTQFATAYGHQKHGLQYICPTCLHNYEMERQTVRLTLKEGFVVCTDIPVVFVDEDGLEYSSVSEYSHYLYTTSEEAESVLEVNTERKSHDMLQRLKVRKVMLDITLIPT